MTGNRIVTSSFLPLPKGEMLSVFFHFAFLMSGPVSFVVFSTVLLF